MSILKKMIELKISQLLNLYILILKKFAIVIDFLNIIANMVFCILFNKNFNFCIKSKMAKILAKNIKYLIKTY